MILVIDNYDSFTYNLVQYIRQIDTDVCVYRNDLITIDEIENMAPDFILLSPGPGRPADALLCREIIKEFSDRIPILGVCLGHQVIVEAFGGRVVKGEHPVHGKVFDAYHNGASVFQGLSNPTPVTRYHSLVARRESLPDCLEVTAWTKAGEVMGVRHKTLNVEGVQFHPESILTRDGFNMLENFFKIPVLSS